MNTVTLADCVKAMTSACGKAGLRLEPSELAGGAVAMYMLYGNGAEVISKRDYIDPIAKTKAPR